MACGLRWDLTQQSASRRKLWPFTFFCGATQCYAKRELRDQYQRWLSIEICSENVAEKCKASRRSPCIAYSDKCEWPCNACTVHHRSQLHTALQLTRRRIWPRPAFFAHKKIFGQAGCGANMWKGSSKPNASCPPLICNERSERRHNNEKCLCLLR